MKMMTRKERFATIMRLLVSQGEAQVVQLAGVALMVADEGFK